MDIVPKPASGCSVTGLYHRSDSDQKPLLMFIVVYDVLTQDLYYSWFL